MLAMRPAEQLPASLLAEVLCAYSPFAFNSQLPASMDHLGM
jgi:hypothetical protein